MNQKLIFLKRNTIKEYKRLRKDACICLRQASKAVSLAELQQLVLKASVLQKHLGLEPEQLSKACPYHTQVSTGSNLQSSNYAKYICDTMSYDLLYRCLLKSI